MHELAVTESILNIAVEHASRANATRVTDIHLVIGRLSSIIDDSIQFYWDMLSENTICTGATLHFQRIPARLQCRNCENEFVLEAELTPCPACGSSQIIVLTGEEFYLDSLEIEQAQDP
jgi:hydrogenase nickel incorporation protein HypA/HybF